MPANGSSDSPRHHHGRARSALYDEPYGPSLVKEIDHISPQYRALIEAAPFVVLATNGPEGLDCSPRGDPPGFVRVRDEQYAADPRPAAATTASTACATWCAIRASRSCSSSPAWARPCASSAARRSRPIRNFARTFALHGKTPRCVLVVTVERAYYQCTKAIIRSKLWDPATQVERGSLPTHRKNPGRDQRRQGGRRRARPRRARADQADDLLSTSARILRSGR